MSKNNFGGLTRNMRAEYARRVKALRLERGITQAELIAKANIAPGTLTNIEQGKAVPHASALERIFDALEVEPDLPRFQRDTEQTLIMFGTLLEAVDPSMRQTVVTNTLLILADAVRANPNVTRLGDDELETMPLDADAYELAASSDNAAPVIDGGHIDDDTEL